MYGRGEDTGKKLCIAGSLFLNLGLLVYFKYLNFLIEFWNKSTGYIHTGGSLSTMEILLPVGISFYIFQAIGYTIDVYRGDVYTERNFLKYALFVSFFPQLVAGPIERSRNLLPQFYKKHRFHKENILLGLKWILWGFFKKIVIADRVSTAVNTIYNAAQSYNGFYFVFATILFAFQIYCDFSGYSDIAFGSAKVLGFDLMHNFEKPYLSKSIKELWRRWHISLSTWFMDYIYIPLGGNRKGKLRKCLNLFITFFVSGIWHGANWTFAVWGAMHGIYLVMGILTENIRKRIKKILHLNNNIIWNFCSIVFTFLLFCASLIIFRANTISDAIYIFQHIFDNIQQWTNAQYIYEIITSMGINLFELTVVILSILFLILLEVITGKDFVIAGVEKTNCVFRLAFYVFLTVWILSTGVFYNSGEFIYFQF